MDVRMRYAERKQRITPGLYDYEFYKQYNYEESKYFKVNQYPSEHKPDFFRKIYKDLEFLPSIKYSHDCRYSKVPTLKEFGKSYHATNRIRGVVYSDMDKYYTVDNSTQNRLDKVSMMFYHTPQLWWAIAQANNIFDSFNVPRGRVLRIPPITNIGKRYF